MAAALLAVRAIPAERDMTDYSYLKAPRALRRPRCHACGVKPSRVGSYYCSMACAAKVGEDTAHAAMLELHWCPWCRMPVRWCEHEGRQVGEAMVDFKRRTQ